MGAALRRLKIVIPGGSGQVGTMLTRSFHADGHEVVVLSRSPRPAPWRVVAWDGRTPSGWIEEFEGADAVINLAGRSVNCRAGRSVNCRYTPENRRAILESRLESTRAIGRA